MEWFMKAMRQYADFNGRSRRKEFWMFSLIVGLASVVLQVLGQYSSLFGIIYLVASLAVLVPAVAVGVRRLHDTGRTGWLMLLAFIPLVNLVVLYWCVLDSQPGPNQYGPNPKETVLQATPA